MTIQYACVIETIDAPVEMVWAIVAGFGALRPWVAGVESCALEGFGIGAVRTVTAMGGVTRERLTLCDPESYLIEYALLDPTILPATGVSSRIELTALADGRTEFRWTSWAERIDAGAESTLTALIDGFYRASIAKLAALTESGTVQT